MEKLKILVVDDEPLIRELFEVLLGRHDVYTAESGESALQMLPKLGGIDLLISDIRMNDGMDGLTFVKLVNNKRKVTTWVCSGTLIEDIGPCNQLPPGVDRLIPKPFNAKQVAQALAEDFPICRIAQQCAKELVG